MMIIAALAATTVALPTLGGPIGNMPEWIRASDYQQVKGEGAALFKTYFKPDGQPDRCVIVRRVGHESVEKLVCSIVFKRFRFKPSLGHDGAPVYRIMQRAAMFMQTGGRSPFVVPPLATLEVSKLPGGGGEENVPVILSIDSTGNLAGCSAPDGLNKNIEALSALACRTLPSIWVPAPEVNAEGAAIAYVRDFTVRFQIAQKTTEGG